jgi:hypothetical protein
MEFVPSLKLSRMLYKDEIAPLMEGKYPNLRHAVAFYGMCSEILGLDDEVAMDHMWGPRVTILLSREDHNRYSKELMSTLRATLPSTFKGFDMTWLKPGVDVQDTTEQILYTVRTTTVSDALAFCGGAEALPLKDVDWLKVSEQHLLEFTNGEVYRDDTGEFTKARQLLMYYPDDVLRFLLMCGWNSVGGDWFPIGRMGSRGDDLGLRIQAAKVSQHLMRLAFMVSRKYCTYRKWFGSLFKRLPIAEELEPVLLALLCEESWQEVEARIWDATAILLRHQNELGIAPEIPIEVQKETNGRHYLACGFWDIGSKTAGKLPLRLQSLQDNEVFWLHEKQLILWNGEVGKWVLFLQKDNT